MLTGDENIADVKFVVFWQIDPSHPEDYAFNLAHQVDTVKAVAESAMREIVGHTQIQQLLTADRKNIEPAAQALMQKVLNSYKAGVLVLQVQLQSVDPPAEVIASFRDVTAAQQDQSRLRNEAETYANKAVPGRARARRRHRADRRGLPRADGGGSQGPGLALRPGLRPVQERAGRHPRAHVPRDDGGAARPAPTR